LLINSSKLLDTNKLARLTVFLLIQPFPCLCGLSSQLETILEIKAVEPKHPKRHLFFFESS